MKTKNQTNEKWPGFHAGVLALTITLFLLHSNGCIPQPPVNMKGGTFNESWTLLRNDDGIALYERWISAEGFPVCRQMGIEFMLRGDLEAVTRVVTDDAMAADWMTAIKSYQILNHVNDSCWYTYTLYDIPWPLKKQEVIIQNTLFEEPDSKSISITMIANAQYIPENRGISRISHMMARWTFTEASKGYVQVQYTMFSGQHSPFPRWLTDPIIQGNLVKTMKNFRRTAEDIFPLSKTYTRQ